MKGRPSPFFKTASRLPSILAPAPSRWVARLPRLVFHFTIAAAAVYYLASRVLLVMVGHVGPCRLLYGELVFLFIFAVMRVSALGPAHFSVATYVTGPIGHTFLVGPSMVLPVRRFAVARMDINGNRYGFDALEMLRSGPPSLLGHRIPRYVRADGRPNLSSSFSATAKRAIRCMVSRRKVRVIV